MKRGKSSENRERLLKAGLRFFSEDGYNGATVRTICDSASSNIAAINYYFGDKLGFYSAVLEYAHSLRRDVFESSWEWLEKDPWETLRIQVNLMLSASYDETMRQVDWLILREMVDSQLDATKKDKPNKERHEKHHHRMLCLLNALLGEEAATDENRSLLHFTYMSLCRFLPIQTYVENNLLPGLALFNVQRSLDQEKLTEYILGVVRRSVEDMRAKARR